MIDSGNDGVVKWKMWSSQEGVPEELLLLLVTYMSLPVTVMLSKQQ